MRQLLLLFAALCCKHAAHAEMFSLNDRNYPYVFINDPVTVPVIWHKKAFGFRLANAAAVRINARGIRFIPGSHALLLSGGGSSLPGKLEGDDGADDILQQAAKLWWNDTLPASEVHAQGNALDASAWRSIRCVPSRGSLCELVSSFPSRSGSVASSRFLPNHPNPVFLSQRDAKLLPIDVARMLGAGRCPESATGRTAIAPQHASDLQQHDISLCNIVGLGSDYVYVPYESRLYVLANPVGNVALIFMSLFVVYLMVVVGHNLQTVLGVGGADSSKKSGGGKGGGGGGNKARWTVACMVGLLLLACFATGPNVMVGFVTVQDYVAFATSAAYVAYYCVRVQTDAKRVSPVNPILASISISVQRVYGSAENPYSQTLAFMALTWLLHKISVLNAKAWIAKEQGILPLVTVRWRRCLDIVADCLLLSVMLYAGVLGQVDTEPSISAIQVLQGILAAMALNRALSSVHFSNLVVK